MPLTRRHLLGGGAAAFAFKSSTLSHIAGLPLDSAGPEDEVFWQLLRSKFDIDPSLTVFNHAGLSPSPRAVNDAIAAQTKRANSDPSYIIWRKQDNELDAVRAQLAELVGCEVDELALTMNATYGLQTAILGVPMQPGDEILATTHEYSRTLTAIDQRARREGIIPVIVPLAVPPEPPELVAKGILGKITAKTRLVVLSQMTFLIGGLMPIREVAAELQARGIPLLVDGAHGIGLLPETITQLGADMYTACLHKWLMGPIGTGVFVVRRPWIRKLWPLHPADSDLDGSIKKFEQVGTRPAAPFLAIHEALEFHKMLGQGPKAARLESLRQRLAQRVLNIPGVRNYGSLDPKLCRVILTVGFERAPAVDLARWLLTKHHIHVTTVIRAGIAAIRISPNVFTTHEEIDRLASALELAAQAGIAS